jgi:hypothetical protein
MHVVMMDVENVLLREIADKRMTRDDVALTYAFAIRQQGQWSGDEVDYAKVNRAIMERWSMAALKYIKEKAWRLVAAQQRGGTA